MEHMAHRPPQGTGLGCYSLSQRMKRSNTTGQVGTAQERDFKQSSYVCNSSKRTRKLRLTHFFIPQMKTCAENKSSLFLPTQRPIDLQSPSVSWNTTKYDTKQEMEKIHFFPKEGEESHHITSL